MSKYDRPNRASPRYKPEHGRVKCMHCGGEYAGKSSHLGERRVLFPSRHLAPDGKLCPGRNVAGRPV